MIFIYVALVSSNEQFKLNKRYFWASIFLLRPLSYLSNNFFLKEEETMNSLSFKSLE
ncbi:MAG: hypothetical protein ACRC1M_06260 [Methanobacteriaceae archaeon]